MTQEYHKPVLLHESVDALVQNPDGVYVDITYGGGGHSDYILSKLSDRGRLIAFDRDADAVDNLLKDKRLILVNHNYRYLRQFLQYFQALPIDGLLGDLGISSHQIDEPERGFAHRFDAPLDMRMDRGSMLRASDILNRYDEARIADIFYQYGELNNARKLASTICSARRVSPIQNTFQLNKIIAECVPPKVQSKYLSQVYQALRIEVNGELNSLKKMLTACIKVIKPGGKLVIISYHSLEDRMVKNFMASGNFEGRRQTDIYGNVQRTFQPEPNKAIVPPREETAENNRARSAKMRIATRL